MELAPSISVDGDVGERSDGGRKKRKGDGRASLAKVNFSAIIPADNSGLKV